MFICLNAENLYVRDLIGDEVELKFPQPELAREAEEDLQRRLYDVVFLQSPRAKEAIRSVQVYYGGQPVVQ